MSDDAPIDPVPTLSYYTPEQSPSLRLLVRLVLAVGICNGLLTAISFGAQPFDGGGPTAPFDFALAAGQVFASLLATATCSTLLASGSGRTVAIGSQCVSMLVMVCFYGRMIFNSQFAPSPFLLAELIADVLSGFLIPLLIIVIAARPDMRKIGAIRAPTPP